MRTTTLERSERRDPRPAAGAASALTLAGIAALLASGCCVLPLVFVLLGVSGTWISQLHRLEPFAAALVTLAFGSLALAAWRVLQLEPTTTAACTADARPSCRTVKAASRRWFCVIAVLTLVPLLVPLVAPLFY